MSSETYRLFLCYRVILFKCVTCQGNSVYPALLRMSVHLSIYLSVCLSVYPSRCTSYSWPAPGHQTVLPQALRPHFSIKDYYTPWTIKNRGTLFLTITTTFLGQFLHFLQQMNRNKYSMMELHIFQIHLSCVYALPCKTFSQHESSNSARNVKFRSQSSQCFIV